MIAPSDGPARGSAEPTLFALSSGAPPAAIAIVRISGSRAGAALEALAGTLPPPRQATLAALRGAEGALLDRALLLWFPGPATATGEDLAELHLHGGRAVVAAVLAALAALPGLSPAPPGAFTRRAFANGRIDLTEAEGLADLLAADSEAQRRQALRLVEGGLGRLLDGWRRRLLDLAAMVEATIDYADEGDVVPPTIAPALSVLAGEIGAALATPPAERLRDGLRVVLAGPVNAGKSSLLNALAGRDAAIVADVAGTTRDLVEVPVEIEGMPLILIDSAGLRASIDPIEQQGVARATAAIERADLVLWLGDPAAVPRDDSLIIAAKCDVVPTVDRGAIAVSVVTGVGLPRLRSEIVRRTRMMSPGEDQIALNERQRGLLRAAQGVLDDALRQPDIILVAEGLRSALGLFDQVVGRGGVEDMLDALFARFCVGK